MSEPPDISDRTSDLLDAYRDTAERWDALQSNADAANEVFEENHAIYKLLRATGEGRAGITRLMAHETVGVRLLAATHALGWAADDAAAVLEVIERGGGLHAVSAKYTLRSHRSGQLDLDW